MGFIFTMLRAYQQDAAMFELPDGLVPDGIVPDGLLPDRRDITDPADDRAGLRR
jgi:hypothetical protein